MQKWKFTEIYSISSNWLLLQSMYKRDMFSTNVEYFCEFSFLHYEKIMRISLWKIGKYSRWAPCYDQYSWVSAMPWKLPFMYWNQQTADYYAGHCTYIVWLKPRRSIFWIRSGHKANLCFFFIYLYLVPQEEDVPNCMFLFQNILTRSLFGYLFEIEIRKIFDTWEQTFINVRVTVIAKKWGAM